MTRTADLQSAFTSAASSARRKTPRVLSLSATLLAVALSFGLLGCAGSKPPAATGVAQPAASASARVVPSTATSETTITAEDAARLAAAASSPDAAASKRIPAASSGAPSAPTRPTLAPRGSALASVATAPEATVSAIKVPAGFTSAKAVAVFEPYGWAPDDSFGRRLAVRVVSWRASDSTVKDLTGRNVLFRLTPDGAIPEVGGRFRADIAVKSDGAGVASLYITTARPER